LNPVAQKQDRTVTEQAEKPMVEERKWNTPAPENSKSSRSRTHNLTALTMGKLIEQDEIGGAKSDSHIRREQGTSGSGGVQREKKTSAQPAPRAGPQIQTDTTEGHHGERTRTATETEGSWGSTKIRGRRPKLARPKLRETTGA
jgi:hypothetical protein